MAENKGVAARLLEGRERSDDGIFSRASKAGRIQLFWDILKGRFGRLVLVNLILVLFFAPLIAVIVLRTITVGGQIIGGPYAGGLGVGAGAIPDVTGTLQYMLLGTDLFFFALLIPGFFIAGIGLSGGAYLIRNLIRTEGVFSLKDFGRGIVRNFWATTEAVLLFSAVLFAARYLGNYVEYSVVMGTSAAGWLIFSEVVGYLLVGLMALVSLWMIAIGTSYKQNPWTLFRSAVVLTFRYFPLTVLFAALSLWPVFIIIFVSGLFFTIFLAAEVFIGLSYSLLVWMDFTQWVFDRSVSPDCVLAVAEEDEKAEDAKEKPAATGEDLRRIIVSYGKSDLISRPIQPVDADMVSLCMLPENFSREDLRRLDESRKELRREVNAYEAAHKSEKRYAEYNKLFEDRDRALQGKGKGKRLAPPAPRRR